MRLAMMNCAAVQGLLWTGTGMLRKKNSSFYNSEIFSVLLPCRHIVKYVLFQWQRAGFASHSFCLVDIVCIWQRAACLSSSSFVFIYLCNSFPKSTESPCPSWINQCCFCAPVPCGLMQLHSRGKSVWPPIQIIYLILQVIGRNYVQP